LREVEGSFVDRREVEGSFAARRGDGGRKTSREAARNVVPRLLWMFLSRKLGSL
jgi:hypothetical protein